MEHVEYALKDTSLQGREYTAFLANTAHGPEVTIVGMKISLGADHAGFELKNQIKEHLNAQGIDVHDRGTNSTESVDYPDFARAVADDVAAENVDLGILVCGTGIGMAISANKVPGIRAANCDTVFEAEMSREHNDANVLALGARVLQPTDAIAIVDSWIHTKFAGGRHQRRIDKIRELENQEVKRLT